MTIPRRSGSTMHVIGSLHGGGTERLLTNLVTQQRTGAGDNVVVCVVIPNRLDTLARESRTPGVKRLPIGLR